MKYLLHICLWGLILFVGITACSNEQRQNVEIDFGGLLYKSVFYSYIPEYDLSKFDTKALPKNIRIRVNEYIERSKKFRSQLIKPKAGEGPKLWGFRKRQVVEKAIVSLIKAEGIENIASKYAKEAVLYYEWEGMSDGPLPEAEFAEEYLKTHPETPIKPYLFLFLIHRYRCAFECLVFEKNLEAQKEASKKYQLYLKYAKESSDPLIRMIAEDIDKQQYLYIKTEKYP